MGAQIVNALTIVDTDVLVDAASQISKAIGLLLQYRLSHGLAIPDALIAATAITFNQPFISKNQRDYRFISGLQLLPYP
jgi:predicted nucleic acid-binding protein